jgi:protein gp37
MKDVADFGKCRKCGGQLRRVRLFADSNSDWLDDKWPTKIRAHFLEKLHRAPNLDVQLLTKRPENFRPLLTDVRDAIKDPELRVWLDQWLAGTKIPENIWIGVSAENQKMADLRIPQLLDIPASVRFVSAEPLLAPIQFDPRWLGVGSRNGDNHGRRGIDWVITGGESGKNRRDVPVGAILSVADQCVAAGVPVYVKQDVAFFSGEQGRIPNSYWAMKQFPFVKM